MTPYKLYIITVLLLYSIIGRAQTTAIPDTIFEQALIDVGYDSVLDGSVLTANISSTTILDVSGVGVTDMTGLQDFVAVEYLNLFENNLTSLDVSANINLNRLDCGRGQITSLDVSNNTALTQLWCDSNQLTNLDVSQNSLLLVLICLNNKIESLDISDKNQLQMLRCQRNRISSLNTTGADSLESINCDNNLLTNLDLSTNIELRTLNASNNSLTKLDVSPNIKLGTVFVSNNALTCLNIRNGNNFFMGLRVSGNPLLDCIEVDDVTQALNQWNVADGDIDSLVTFSLDCANSCSPTGINENESLEKHLIQVTDLLGRRVGIRSNQILIFRYSDGSAEKRLLVE